MTVSAQPPPQSGTLALSGAANGGIAYTVCPVVVSIGDRTVERHTRRPVLS
jgi:hypothetical protein